MSAIRVAPTVSGFFFFFLSFLFFSFLSGFWDEMVGG